IDKNAVFEKTLTYNTSMLIINLTLSKNWKLKNSSETFTETDDDIFLSMPPLINKKKGYEIYITFEKKNTAKQDLHPEYYLFSIVILAICVGLLLFKVNKKNNKRKSENKQKKKILSEPNEVKLRKIKETIHNLDLSYKKGKLDKETYTKLRNEYKEKALELLSKEKRKYSIK
ncbi:MAG: hypothetical protein QXT63_09020, partial [Thermoplasmata archaeon]